MSRPGVGDLAPLFVLPDESGEPCSLADLLARGPVVLFFYPATGSYGCTRECRIFRDRSDEFAASRAQRVGISPDAVSTQEQFARANALGYPLLADPDLAVASAYGVRRSFGPLAIRRWTFVIATDRRILAVLKSETNMGSHAQRALEVLRAHAAPA